MNNNKGSIEILLVLCCLVGVVAFLCFAMGAINLGRGMEQKINSDPTLLGKKRDDLLAIKQQKEEEMKRLEKEIDELKTHTAELEKKLASTNIPEIERDKIKKYEVFKNLNEQLEKLLKQIEEKKELLVKAKQGLINLEEMKKKVAEIEKLNRQLNALESQIKEKKVELNKLLASLSVIDSVEEDKEKLKKLIEEAEKRKRALAKKIDEIGDGWGNSFFNNPLFVECKDNLIVFHPEKKILNITDLDKGNQFLSNSYGHDGVIFFVRPNGFEIFNKSFQQAREAKLRLAYMPVDAEKNLPFIGGKK